MTPKAIGDTPTDTDTDTDVTMSSSDDSGDPTGDPLQCPDNPGMCADVDHDFCEQDPGGPDSLFDADCCPRPRCDGGDPCDNGRVCIGVGLYGGGGPSSLSCVEEDGMCGCGGTADGAYDVRVCMDPEDVPSMPPAVCTTAEVGTAFTITDPLPNTVDGYWLCDVTEVGAAGFALDCAAGEVSGSPSFVFGDDVDGVPLTLGEQVAIDYRSDDTGGRPAVWVRIDKDTGPAIVLGMGETLVQPGDNPPWPEGVAPLEAVDAGCPVIGCEPDGPTWSGRLVRSGFDVFDVAVGPGEAMVVNPDQEEAPPAVLHVYEAHAGNCGPHAGQPAFYTYALIQQQI